MERTKKCENKAIIVVVDIKIFFSTLRNKVKLETYFYQKKKQTRAMKNKNGRNENEDQMQLSQNKSSTENGDTRKN